MGVRHPNPRLVKVHRNYSVEEVARLFSLHKNTVRNWLKLGLPAIDDRRPPDPRPGAVPVPARAPAQGQAVLRAGSDFLHRLPRAQNTGRENGGLHRHSPTAGSLCGICPDCGRLIYRRINLAKMDAVRGELEIAFTQPRPRLEETTNPNVNCDSTEGDHR
jgi:hypothetical protein